MQDRTPVNPDFLSARSSHHWALTGPGHGVQFYRDDAERMRVLTDFVTDGLKAGPLQTTNPLSATIAWPSG